MLEEPEVESSQISENDYADYSLKAHDMVVASRIRLQGTGGKAGVVRS